MALAIDTATGHSDPAGLFFHRSSAARPVTFSSNSITAGANSLVVVMSTINAVAAQKQTLTISDTAGLTWTLIGQQDATVNSSTYGISAAAWWAYTTAGATTTVS